MWHARKRKRKPDPLKRHWRYPGSGCWWIESGRWWQFQIVDRIGNVVIIEPREREWRGPPQLPVSLLSPIADRLRDPLEQPPEEEMEDYAAESRGSHWRRRRWRG